MITNEQYQLIFELEREYQSLINVPKNDSRLLQLNSSFNDFPNARLGRYDYDFTKAVYLAKEGYAIEEIALECNKGRRYIVRDLSRLGLKCMPWFDYKLTNIQTGKTFYFTSIRNTAMFLKTSIKRLNKHFDEPIKGYRMEKVHVTKPHVKNGIFVQY